MVTFNLLPWRTNMRLYQIRKFKITLLAVIILMVMLLVVMHVILISNEKKMNSHVAKLKKELKRYDRHTQHSPSNVNLYDKKMMTVLFAGLNQINSYAVCFTDVERNTNKIIFDGLTPSAYELTEFFNQWNMGNLFSEVQIQKIEKQDNGLVRFVFQAVLI